MSEDDLYSHSSHSLPQIPSWSDHRRTVVVEIASEKSRAKLVVSVGNVAVLVYERGNAIGLFCAIACRNNFARHKNLQNPCLSYFDIISLVLRLGRHSCSV